MVSSNTGGPKEIILDNETGYLVEHERDAFVEKILYLLKHEDFRKEMSKKAKYWTNKKFSTHQFDEILKRVF